MSRRNFDEPHWSLRFLKWFCPDHLYEEIEGDLIQKFNADIRKYGEPKARRRLSRNVLYFFRPGIIGRSRFDFARNQNLMFRIHTKIVARQVAKNKTFSLINMMGLTVGLSVCLLIAQFVAFERSFERFNSNAERTYRVNLYNTHNGVFDNISHQTVSGLAHSITESIPGVESIGRIGDKTSAIVSSEVLNTADRENEILFADPRIPDLLALEFIDGVKERALSRPQSIIISETAARKYFGESRATGKVLHIGFNSSSIEKKQFEVQGVFRDIPPNSHLRFHFVLAPANDKAWNENWAWSNVITYLRLPEDVNPADLEPALGSIVRLHHTDSLTDRYMLEPLSDVRLHALDGTGRASLNNFIILLGAVILFLAWFNYINLCTARTLERMKEVGIRKLIGASRAHLVLQLLTESFLFNIVSYSGAICIFFVSWPFVTDFLEQPMPITLFTNWSTVIVIPIFIVVSAASAGLYPALILSSFKPLQSVRGRLNRFVDRSVLRRFMVAAQFAVSLILITGVFAIRKQVGFMRAQELGISLNQTLIIEEPLLTDATSAAKFETLKHEILQIPNVSGVTYASSFPGAEIDWHRTDITLGQENSDYRYDSRIVAIGTEFIDVFGLTLLAGRNFQEASEDDKRAMLLSEQACKMFGFNNYNDALGKIVFIGSRRFEVIGVVKNYHFRSPQESIQPVLYMLGHPRGPRFAVKVLPREISPTISSIESKWKSAYTGNVFRYYFLDDFFDRQYNSDRVIEKIVATLAILATFISCSGLFALSLYSVNGRTKEISIRKVFGASVSNVVMLLSRDFIKLVILGSVLAIPPAYQVVQIWLERYAHKMPVDAWLFVLPVAVTILLAAVTISFQTFSTARKNPVESMKYE